MSEIIKDQGEELDFAELLEQSLNEKLYTGKSAQSPDDGGEDGNFKKLLFGHKKALRLHSDGNQNRVQIRNVVGAEDKAPIFGNIFQSLEPEAVNDADKGGGYSTPKVIKAHGILPSAGYFIRERMTVSSLSMDSSRVHSVVSTKTASGACFSEIKQANKLLTATLTGMLEEIHD